MTTAGARPYTSIASATGREVSRRLGLGMVTGRVASRAIPVVGWALLIWDLENLSGPSQASRANSSSPYQPDATRVAIPLIIK